MITPWHLWNPRPRTLPDGVTVGLAFVASLRPAGSCDMTLLELAVRRAALAA